MSLATQISNALTRVGTEFKTVYAQVGSLAALTTTDKSTVVAAVNEVKAAATAAASAAASLINDAAPATTSVYSSSKTDAQVATAVANLVNSAPGTLDTLGEIATQLGSDESAAVILTTAVGNRVRYDAAQVLTGPQKTQAQTNIDAASATNVGDTTTDFVAVFVAALV